MGKILSKEEWLRRRRLKNSFMLATAIILLICIIIISIVLICKILGVASNQKKASVSNTKETIALNILQESGTVIQTEYLTPNKYSRPKLTLKKINGIVVHYTANPGTSAEANRSYFEGLAVKRTTYASSHYIIGLEGEIVQCIPLTEESFASNNRNKDTISIECCHPDITGKFNDKTYHSLVTLVAALCVSYNLKEKDIIRHYDVTGKECPLYYVKHENEWNILKKDIITEAKDIKNMR